MNITLKTPLISVLQNYKELLNQDKDLLCPDYFNNMEYCLNKFIIYIENSKSRSKYKFERIISIFDHFHKIIDPYEMMLINEFFKSFNEYIIEKNIENLSDILWQFSYFFNDGEYSRYVTRRIKGDFILIKVPIGSSLRIGENFILKEGESTIVCVNQSTYTGKFYDPYKIKLLTGKMNDNYGFLRVKIKSDSFSEYYNAYVPMHWVKSLAINFDEKNNLYTWENIGYNDGTDYNDKANKYMTNLNLNSY